MRGIVCIQRREASACAGEAETAQSLSPGELVRLQRFTVPKRREEWLLGRMAARAAVLSLLKRSGLEPPAPSALEVVTESDGAPRVIWLQGAHLPEVSVSLTHQGGWAAAWATFREPGVSHGIDLEQVIPREPGLVDQFFTDEERDWVERLEPGRQAWGVNVIWSLKEAALKALRLGLRADTRQVRVLEVRENGEAELELDPLIAPGLAVRAALWEQLDDRVLTRVELEQPAA